MRINDIKNDVVKAAKKLYNAKLVLPGEGNISVRIPGKEAMVITPTMNTYEDLQAEDLVVMSLDGHIDPQRSGSRKASTEYRMHAALLHKRPLAAAVVHAHPPETVTHAVLGINIPLIVEEMAILLGGPVPCTQYQCTGSDNLVAAALGSIGTGNAVMLANHGLLCCGRSLEAALDTVFVVEKLAGINRRAQAFNQPSKEIPTDAVADLVNIFQERFSTA